MKFVIAALMIITSFTTLANEARTNCQSQALKVAKAIDKIYVPNLARGTKISASEHERDEHTQTIDVDYYVPNAGGSTSYRIKLGTEGCYLINVSVLAE